MVKRALSGPSRSLLFFQLTCPVNLFYQTPNSRSRPARPISGRWNSWCI